jgi:hypothetical protein
MKIKTVKKIFECLYPELEIVDVEILNRNQYINGVWVEDTPSVFVRIKNNNEISDLVKLSDTLTELTNREFNVFLT